MTTTEAQQMMGQQVATDCEIEGTLEYLTGDWAGVRDASGRLDEIQTVRLLYPCGCEAWRPSSADENWHLTTCGIAPAPTHLRLA